MEKVRSLQPPPASPPLRLGASWLLEPSLNFYREPMGLAWLREIRRESPGDRSFDFYALLEEDRHLVTQGHLVVLLDDPISGAVLATPLRSQPAATVGVAAGAPRLLQRPD